MSGKREEREEEEGQNELDFAVTTEKKVKRPKRYKVLLHNDDYTPMEFVIMLLQKIFFKSKDQAHEIMLKVHGEGVGICGIYTHEIAESKQSQTIQMAKENGHPLKSTMEEE